MWLFSFYFGGMRASDVMRLRWDDFRDSRIYYTMGKNSKSVSLKIPEKAQKILSLYRSQRRHVEDLYFLNSKILKRLMIIMLCKKRLQIVLAVLNKF